MSTRRNEHIEAAREEAYRLGATFELVQGRKSFIATIGFNGKSKKTAMSITPSRHAAKRCVCIVRQYVREMSHAD